MAVTVSLSDGTVEYLLSQDAGFLRRVETQLKKKASEILGESTTKSATITRAGQVATVACTSHGFIVGEPVLVAGATQPEYNGIFVVTTVPNANSFTYAVPGSPATPATGTITVAKAYRGLRVNYAKLVMQNSAGETQRAALVLAQSTNVVVFGITYDDGGVRTAASDADIYAQINTDWNKLAQIDTGN